MICRHCHEPIRQRVAFASQTVQWVASAAYPFGDWPFCPAVNGRAHMPL